MPEDAARAMDEKEVKSAVEAVTAVRERMDSLEEKTEKIASLEAKMAALDGVDKEVIEKANARLDSYEEKNQALTLENEAIKKEAKKSKLRFETIEKSLILKSTESPSDYKTTPEYKAYNVFLKEYGKGADFSLARIPEEHKSYLRTDVGTEGGYTVPTVLDTQMLKTITEITPMLQLVRTRNLPGVKKLDISIRTSIPTLRWVGEAQEAEESNSGYQLGSLTAHAAQIETTTTRDLLNFSASDMVSELFTDANEAFAEGLGAVLLQGNGVEKPQGFLDPTANIETLDSPGGVVPFDKVIELLGKLKIGYTRTYGFNLNTLVSLRTEKDSNGNYLWRIGGESMPSTIVDVPYVILQAMPDIAVGATPVILGDFFRAYTFLDAMGMEIIRDDITQANKRLVNFNFFRFVDGKVTVPEAVKLIKVSA